MVFWTDNLTIWTLESFGHGCVARKYTSACRCSATSAQFPFRRVGMRPSKRPRSCARCSWSSCGTRRSSPRGPGPSASARSGTHDPLGVGWYAVETFDGSFSAASRPIFATKYAVLSIQYSSKSAFLYKVQFGTLQKCANIVELERCCKMHVYLQISVSV